jgi:ornithine cyclodeaminase/alanine dehydrogenase-like protein (mu-crystallin family)
LVLIVRRDEVARTLLGRKVDFAGARELLERALRGLGEHNQVVSYRDERTRIVYPPEAEAAQTERDLWIMPMYLPAIDCGAMRIGTGEDCVIALYDFEYLGLQAYLQDQPLARLRSALPSVVAAKYLRRRGPHTMGLVGNRGVMMAHEASDPEQLAELSGIRRYHPPAGGRAGATSRQPGRRATFSGLREAVEGHAVVHLILEPDRPVYIEDAWASPGQLITTTDLGAIAPETLARATVIHASRRHAPRDAGEVVELGDVMRGDHPGRTSGEQIIVFVAPLGMGFVDVATGWWGFQQAQARGFGVEVPLVSENQVDEEAGL